jgi:hypothetical protein
MLRRPSTALEPHTPQEAARVLVAFTHRPRTSEDYQRELKDPRSPLRQALQVLYQRVWIKEEVEIAETLTALREAAVQVKQEEMEEIEEASYQADQKLAQAAAPQSKPTPHLVRVPAIDFGQGISPKAGQGLIELLTSLSALLRRWLKKPHASIDLLPAERPEEEEALSARNPHRSLSLRARFGLFKLRPGARRLSPEELEELMRQEGGRARFSNRH